MYWKRLETLIASLDTPSRFIRTSAFKELSGKYPVFVDIIGPSTSMK